MSDLPNATIQVIHNNNNRNDDVYLTIKLDGMKRPVTVLVDTGADVSLLKVDNISNHNRIDTLSKRTIGGAFNGSSNTLGVFNTFWLVNDKSIATSWQVVSSNNDIPLDGIVGRDILWHRTSIDTRAKTLTLYSIEGTYLQTWPLENAPKQDHITTDNKKATVKTIKIHENNLHKNNWQLELWKGNAPHENICELAVERSCHWLESRTINIIKIRVPEPEDTEIVIPAQELGPGILMGNSVSTINKGYENGINIELQFLSSKD